MGLDHDTFASAGCQVVVGYPQCSKRNNQQDSGPWKIFKRNAYRLAQKQFSYFLLPGRSAQKVSLEHAKKLYPRLRFGSKGELAKKLQKRLRKADFYEGELDGDFGERTLFAVLRYQTVTFDARSDDGIVGPVTADALGLRWPRI